VLAVVQHQQRRAGTERGHDAGERVGRDGALADGAAPRRPGTDGRGDLPGDVVVGGDAGQGDELHHPLLGAAADRLGQAGLAQAAGADDRGDPRGAQQARHRDEVVVAAEQRVGLLRHAVADHRQAALEQLVLQRLERGAGVAAELLAQRAAVGLEAGQRRRRPLGGRLAAQQLGQHLLVPRAVAGERGERRGRLGVAAQPRQRQRAGPHQRPLGRGPLRAQRSHRVVGPAVAGRGPRPQRQSRLGVRQRRRLVAGLGAAGGRRRPQLGHRGVDLVLAKGEPVAGRGGDDEVGAQLGSGAGDEDLQRLRRVLGLLVRPEPFHQPGGAAAPAQVAGEQRQEAAQPRRGDLPALVGHPRQQRQLGAHPTSLASSPPASLMPAPAPGASTRSRALPLVRAPQHGGELLMRTVRPDQDARE
jgi:hypothetical protein